MHRKTSRSVVALSIVLIFASVVPARAIGNSAPTLDSTRSPVLASVAEDASAPSGAIGTLVNSLVDFNVPSGGNDNVTDSDGGALLGIAITAVNTSNCSQVSFYDGTSWTAITGVSTSNALLLAADATYRVYCQPTANYSGTISNAITFQAWDQTSGTAGGFADVTTNGGSTAFSIASDTVSQSVTAVNDAPTLDPSKSPTLATVFAPASPPSGAVGSLVSELVDFATPAGQLDNVSDPDSGPSLGMAITGSDSSVGALFYSINGGTTWSLATSLSDSNAVLLSADPSNRVYFSPNPTYVGRLSAAITFRAWDTTSGSSGTLTNITATGGTTAFSATTDTASLNVIEINSAPVLDASRTPLLTSEFEDAGAPVGAVGTPISSLVDFATPAGGLDNVTDSNISPVTGIAVTGVDTTLCANWKFYNGVVWTDFPAVSSTTALLLPANGSYRVYCVPTVNANGTASAGLTFRAWDQVSGSAGQTMSVGTPGGTTSLSFVEDTASISVIAVNDAPVLDASKQPVLPTISQGANAPSGTVGVTVDSLVDAAVPAGGLDNVSDIDASPSYGIAVTAFSSANGTAYFSVNNGSTWTQITSLSNSNTLVLRASSSNRLYFRPAATFNGTIQAAFTIRAWDVTAENSGTFVAIAAAGSDTAYSAATDSVSLSVKAATVKPTPKPTPTPTPSTKPSSQTKLVATENIFFRQSSAVLSEKSQSKLDALIAAHPKAVKWEVTGYVRVGGHMSAKSLSGKRAEQVRDYLRSRGVKVQIVTTAGGYPRNRGSVQARRATIKVFEANKVKTKPTVTPAAVGSVKAELFAAQLNYVIDVADPNACAQVDMKVTLTSTTSSNKYEKTIPGSGEPIVGGSQYVNCNFSAQLTNIPVGSYSLEYLVSGHSYLNSYTPGDVSPWYTLDTSVSNSIKVNLNSPVNVVNKQTTSLNKVSLSVFI